MKEAWSLSVGHIEGGVATVPFITTLSSHGNIKGDMVFVLITVSEREVASVHVSLSNRGVAFVFSIYIKRCGLCAHQC